MLTLHRLPAHSIQNVYVKSREDTLTRYHLFTFEELGLPIDLVDFTKSSFILETIKGRRTALAISNSQDYYGFLRFQEQENKSKDLFSREFIKALKIEFTAPFGPPLDLAIFNKSDSDFYCRASLRTALEGGGITGIEFRPRAVLKLE